MSLRMLRKPVFRSMATGPKGRNVEGEGKMTKSHKLMTDILRPVAPPPPRTKEEQTHLRKLMIRYGKIKRKQDIEMKIREREFLRAKWSAINSLPHLRKLEALNTIPEPLPVNTPLMTDTPPIKNFNVASMTKM